MVRRTQAALKARTRRRGFFVAPLLCALSPQAQLAGERWGMGVGV